MNIRIDALVPSFLEGKIPTGNLWAKQIALDDTGYFLINANSGKGKSTLLSYLFGVRKDYQGTIHFNNKNLREFNIDDWADWRSKKISMVFQELKLFPQLTALQNVLMKNELTKHFSLEQTRELFSRLGILEFLDIPCNRLSLGQQQRVAIIRALHQSFECILLDEPFSHLDVENASIAFNLIMEQCKAQNAMMILSSLGSNHGFNFTETFNLAS